MGNLCVCVLGGGGGGGTCLLCMNEGVISILGRMMM